MIGDWLKRYFTKIKPVVTYTPENPPPFLEDGDRRVYVCHGEKVWGNSIEVSATAEHDYRVVGWLASAPFPRVGDELIVEMASGNGWGRFVFSDVNPQHDPHDQFIGRAFGAYGYSELVPKTKQPDEFIKQSGVVFFRT